MADLPCPGRPVRLQIEARRLRCEAPHCRRRIFAERFGDELVPARSRRTGRLDTVVHYLGLALGGRPGAALARRLMVPVSNDTLLRTVRRRSRRPTEPPAVIGIDDWAWRRNHRYGSLVCDLERRRIVALLPDREVRTVEAWFAGHRQIRVVSRDRGGGYGEAAARAVPDALQVADRWHLMENASAAFLNAVRRSMRAIGSAVGATTVPADQHAVMVLDQAGGHGAKALRVPDNVMLVPLPPYSPELNPVERVWLYLRERYLSHRLLADYEAAVDACCNAWNALTAEAGRIRSLTAYPYIE